jgi:ATP-dependent Clp protease protease subunit
MRNWKKLSNEADDDGKQQIITLSTDGLNNNSSAVGNKIYLYDDINRQSILNISKQIDEVTRQLKMFQLFYNLKDSPVIELHISTDGGEISPALSLVDKIKTNKVPIHTYVEGMVASAGTLISVAGKRRFITPNSHILVHQISSGAVGNFEQITDEKQNLDLFMSILKKIYLEHTKFKNKQLTELLKHDLCLTSDQALEFGVVDEIL